MSIEAQYLANKLAKGFLRTVHIESNSRLCMASAGTGYKQSLGADGPPGSYTDFDHADLFFVIGVEHGRLPSDPVPADGRPAQGRRQADRRRPAPHRHRREGRPVPADQPGHRPRAAQRPAAPAGRRTATSTRSSSPSTPRAGRRCPSSSPTTRPTRVAEHHRPGRGRHPHRRGDDRRGRRVDDAAGRWGSTRAPTAPGTPTPSATCTWPPARSAGRAADRCR